MKTIEEIKKEIAKECGEEHFEVLLKAEIDVGDFKIAQSLWNRIGDRYIAQFKDKTA